MDRRRQGERGRPGGGGGRGRQGPAGSAPARPARPAPRPRDEAVVDSGRDAAPPPAPGGPSPVPLPAEPVSVTITGMAYGGEAVGRLADGTVIFVWGAMPGEEVLVQITDQRKRFMRGQVREVVAASPDRVTPPCPIFGVCGGCQWQHMAYPAQVEAKQAILLEQVQPAYPEARTRLRPPVTMADPWRYRNVAHFTGDAAQQPAFRRWQSHDLIAITDCPITQPAVTAALGRFRSDLAPGERLSLRCTADGEQVQAWRSELADQAERAIVEVIGDYRYRVSPGAFFQVNTRRVARQPLSGLDDGKAAPRGPVTSLTEDLVRLVLEGVAGYTNQTVVDAYSGVGLFALPLAAQAPRVIGIEESDVAVIDALENASMAGLTNTVFLRGSAATVLPVIAEAVSAVVLDPPRGGVDERALAAIIGKGVPRIVYVSCNPSTLGRDLAALARGGYALDWLRLIDLFPQTLHIESVAVLTLR